ncbi:MAG: response regulator [Deltaproteobacteria bacterium]|nr:response regulator [Deltaproteobacteria bacterium]
MNETGYILVVEDSKTQARQLEESLKPLGYGVSLAYNGKEALDIMRLQRPTLVIADILMPELDGFQLCKIIKADDKLKEVPVVLITQLSDPHEIVRGMECGADDFIVKPYNEDFLLTRIQSILKVKSEEHEAAKEVVILVVEDSPTQAEQLQFMLQENGYTVHLASNGQEGLEAARRLKPTIIISDILMPVMNGYEFAYEIKHDPELKKTPVILVTSLLDTKEVVRKASVVADGYFTKPFDDRYLLSKVEAILAASRLGAEGETEKLDVSFAGEHYAIASGRRQILTFLLSIYENAVLQNRDLILMQRELQLLNEQLEERVIERTRQLKASEAKYRTLLETSADAIVVAGLAGTVHFANKAAESLFGLRSEELIDKPFLVPVVESGIRDIEIIRKNGEKAIAEMRAVKTTWGEEEAYLATFREITSRKRMEEELRESEENFRALADNANDGIVITAGASGAIAYANRRFAEMSGHTVDELHDLSISGLLSPNDTVDNGSFFKDLLEGAHYLDQKEVNIKKRGGRLPVELVASRTLWHGHSALIIILRDIAERKKREEEILKASKLESLGTLAGGIAHDFNNLLTGIMGNVSIARMLAGRDERIRKALTDAENASIRAKDLTHQLLTFARGGAPVKKLASVAQVIKESAAFSVRGSNIRCDLDVPENLHPIEIDEGQISQVIHNLIINSEQAMPDGGVIGVKAENVTVDLADNLPLSPGRFVKITVSDTGVGIPPEVISKIFDPYFTTKDEGSGLGLATVYSIIKNHGGFVTLESTVGAGTSFYLYLPATEGKSQPSEKAAEKTGTVPGSGRILIMDDEEIVRDAAGAILTELGYEVAFAGDGEEAIEAYKGGLASGRPYDAVIMDLTIPAGMGGKEAIKKLLEIDPSARAIVSSGYSNDSIMSEFAKYGFAAVIAKPYRISDLSQTVHRVIYSRKP